VIALGLVVAALTSAEAPVTIDDALKLLREQSPQTAADRAQLEVTAAEQITASTLPNPSFAYTGQELLAGKNTGSIGAHQLTVEPAPFSWRAGGTLLFAHARHHPEIRPARLDSRGSFPVVLLPGGGAGCRAIHRCHLEQSQRAVERRLVPALLSRDLARVDRQAGFGERILCGGSREPQRQPK